MPTAEELGGGRPLGIGHAPAGISNASANLGLQFDGALILLKQIPGAIRNLT